MGTRMRHREVVGATVSVPPLTIGLGSRIRIGTDATIQLPSSSAIAVTAETGPALPYAASVLIRHQVGAASAF